MVTEIRQLWPESKVRVVAVTADAFEDRRNQCLASGFDGWLAKPFRVEDLVKIMEAVSWVVFLTYLLVTAVLWAFSFYSGSGFLTCVRYINTADNLMSIQGVCWAMILLQLFSELLASTVDLGWECFGVCAAASWYCQPVQVRQQQHSARWLTAAKGLVGSCLGLPGLIAGLVTSFCLSAVNLQVLYPIVWSSLLIYMHSIIAKPSFYLFLMLIQSRLIYLNSVFDAWQHKHVCCQLLKLTG